MFDISNLHVDNWLVIQAINDNLAPLASVQQVIDQVQHPKPYRRVVVPGYNHIDLVASNDCDIRVNFPILNFLEAKQLPRRKISSKTRPQRET